MESIVMGAIAALASLAGPAADSYERYRPVKDSAYQQLAGIAANARLDARNYSLPIASKLQSRAIGPEDNARVLAFLRSHEGGQLIRAICVEVLTGGGGKGGKHPNLEREAEALMHLHFGTAEALFVESSDVIVETLIEIIDNIYSATIKENKELANLLRMQALSTSRANDRWPRQFRRSAPPWGQGLPPSAVVANLQEYGRVLGEESAQISVPSVRREIRSSIHDMLITRVFDSPFGRVEADDLLAMQAQSGYLALLGDPGAGKSTSLQATTHVLANRLAGGDLRAIPVRLQLRQFSKHLQDRPYRNLFDYLVDVVNEEFGAELDHDVWRYFLEIGQCAIYLDGLDEVLDVGLRRSVVGKIERFVASYPFCSFVVTCRAVDYEVVGLHAGFARALIQPLSDSAAKSYAKRFFALGDLPHDLRDVQDFFDETDCVRDLRSNMLLLSVLCNLYSTGRRMPTSRLEVYSECAQMLFSDWDSSRGIRVPVKQQAKIEEAVRAIALEVFDSGSEEFGERWLQTRLVEFYSSLPGETSRTATAFARRALDLWRGRKWVMSPAGTLYDQVLFRFTHRSFLEYFAANELAYSCDDGSALCDRLSYLIEHGAAPSFCLLAAEDFFASRRSASSEVLSALHARRASLLDGGHVLRAHYVTKFMANLLGRADWAARDLRLGVSAGIVDTLERALPYVGLVKDDVVSPSTVRDISMEASRMVLSVDISTVGALEHPSYASNVVGRALTGEQLEVLRVPDLLSSIVLIADSANNETSAHVKGLCKRLEERLEANPSRGIAAFAYLWAATSLGNEGGTRFSVLAQVRSELVSVLPAFRSSVRKIHAGQLDYWSGLQALTLGADVPLLWISGLRTADFYVPAGWGNQSGFDVTVGELLFATIADTPEEPLPTAAGLSVRMVEPLAQHYERRVLLSSPQAKPSVLRVGRFVPHNGSSSALVLRYPIAFVTLALALEAQDLAVLRYSGGMLSVDLVERLKTISASHSVLTPEGLAVLDDVFSWLAVPDATSTLASIAGHLGALKPRADREEWSASRGQPSP